MGGPSPRHIPRGPATCPCQHRPPWPCGSSPVGPVPARPPAVAFPRSVRGKRASRRFTSWSRVHVAFAHHVRAQRPAQRMASCPAGGGGHVPSSKYGLVGEVVIRVVRSCAALGSARSDHGPELNRAGPIHGPRAVVWRHPRPPRHPVCARDQGPGPIPAPGPAATSTHRGPLPGSLPTLRVRSFDAVRIKQPAAPPHAIAAGLPAHICSATQTPPPVHATVTGCGPNARSAPCGPGSPSRLRV